MKLARVALAASLSLAVLTPVAASAATQVPRPVHASSVPVPRPFMASSAPVPRPGWGLGHSVPVPHPFVASTVKPRPGWANNHSVPRPVHANSAPTPLRGPR